MGDPVAARLKVFVGWDQRDALAYRVCEKSILDHASIPVEIIPLKDWELRHRGCYWRPYNVDERGQMWDGRDGRPFSTNFAFTRFCVPWLCDYKNEWVVFCDADMLWQADVAELLTLRDEKMAVMCVQHDHRPPEVSKMDGVMQVVYSRKNWSSMMVMNPSRCNALTPYAVNNQSGAWLHKMLWVDDGDIGNLPEEWNWLEGWSSPDLEPKVIHYTRGTPDMDSNVMHAGKWLEVAASL